MALHRNTVRAYASNLPGRSRTANFRSSRRDWSRAHLAPGQVYRLVKKATGKWPEIIAILAPSGAGVGRVSAALNGATKPVRHKVLFDEAAALLSARSFFARAQAGGKSLY